MGKAPDLTATETLTAGASGSTSLPLSDRDASWDAAAAKKSLGEGQYADAHFWRDPEGDPKTLAAYKLPFASAGGGKLTAVWKGVTASAGALQGARGGVQIPEADVAAVRAKIEKYYAAARKAYGDDSIQAPWADGNASVETADALTITESGEGTQISQADLQPIGDFQHGVRCECGHQVAEHIGSDGPCKHEDGRGTCSCGGFAELQTDESAQQAQTLTLNFELRDFRPVGEVPEEELVALARRVYETRDETLAADGATDATLPAEHQPGEQLPAVHPSPAEAVPVQPVRSDNASLRWTATIVPEATMTDDGRAFAPGAITWRDLPLTLGAMLDTPHADVVTESRACGRIDQIWREGNLLKATGVFDAGEFGQNVARMVGEGTIRGVSVDVAAKSVEVGPRSDWFDEDGNWLSEDERPDDAGEPSLVDILFGGEDTIYVITEGVIGAVTVCPFPAFADAQIQVEASLAASASPAVWTATSQAGWVVIPETLTVARLAEAVEGILDVLAEPLTASAAGLVPVKPPAAWFTNPAFDGLTALTVDADGRVYGHAAAFDVCHIGIPDVCTTAPRSQANYAYYLLKEIECADGERVAVGTITLDTDHAARHLGRADTVAHYDNTGTAVADVVVGEDMFGIWVAGALRPDVDAEKARALSGAVLSGDWRNMNGNLELVALLAVNVPGFPVPRTRALVAAGEEGNQVLALVAAGVNVPREGLSDEDRQRLLALAARARGEPTEADFAALAARARGDG